MPRSFARNPPTFQADRPARRWRKPDKPGRTRRNRYTPPDRCTTSFRSRISRRPFSGGYNPPDMRSHRQRPWFQCKVLRLRKPSYSSLASSLQLLGVAHPLHTTYGWTADGEFGHFNGDPSWVEQSNGKTPFWDTDE